jgi:ketosteroid isomerase-like protein
MKLMVIFFLLFFVSCHNHPKIVDRESLKAEIVRTEQNFASLAKEKGVAEAFGYFADSSAVIQRGNGLIIGKDSIRAFYQSRIKPGTILDWAPDFVEVSVAGDLGYTYGKYTISIPDSTGQPVKSSGIFHTVWKKKPDGTWRFVWG